MSEDISIPLKVKIKINKKPVKKKLKMIYPTNYLTIESVQT